MTQVESEVIFTGDDAALRRMIEAIVRGQHWYTALLETIGLWSSAEEVYDERTWHYLIAGEAFDWLLLAQRLCEAAGDIIPVAERDALLFRGVPPIDITREEFHKLIGGRKYHQYLNYFYGITVEESLIMAVQEEVRKERRGMGFNTDHDASDRAYYRIYGDTQAGLLKKSREEKGHPLQQSLTLTEMKEFTYWLFKYRVKACDKAKVASDTKKALDRLKTSCPFKISPVAP